MLTAMVLRSEKRRPRNTIREHRSRLVQKRLEFVEWGACDDPVHFPFHAEGRKDESENEHIDEVDGCSYLESDDDIGGRGRTLGELMVQNEERTALEQPDKAEKSEPAHASRIAEKVTVSFRKSASNGPEAREIALIEKRTCSLRAESVFLEVLPE